MTKEDWPETVLTFSMGVVAGALIAWLTAPKSGNDLRAEISDQAGEGLRNVRKKGKHLKRQAQRAVERVTDSAGEAIDAGESAFRDARNA